MKARSMPRAGAGRLLPKSESDELYRSCEGALTPIAAQFLELGFGAGSFLQSAKKAYVNAAAAAISRSGERPTHSRIAAITGLQRKEVKALSEGWMDETSLLGKLPPTARVIAGWRADPAFLQKSGKPRALRIEGDNSFKTLVARYGGDVTHVSLMRELQRSALLKQRDDGLLELQQGSAPAQERLKDAENFAARIADYAAALSTKGRAAQIGSYVGHRVASPSDPRIGAAMARTFARRAEDFLNGFERWVARSVAVRAGVQPADAGTFSLGIYLVERSAEDSTTRPERERATRRAKRA
jgi:hypothetical protein